MRTARHLAAIALSALAAVPAAHAAQPAFPDRPIRLIIGSAPGSGPDIISRLLADHLYGAWNQRVVVDSRPGVAGAISAEMTLRANPDGYTWMMLTSQLFVATTVYPDLKFDLDKDFVSVAMIGIVPYVLMVNPQVPAKSVTELIALAKKSPGKLKYGSAGAGGGEHITTVLFERMSGSSMLHVPYKGIAQALLDAIAGEVQFAFPVYPAARPHIDSGRLRPFGVTGQKRAPGLPDVPAIAEVLPGYWNVGWYAIVAPKGTPRAIVTKAAEETVKATQVPAFGEKLKILGVEITAGGPKELDAFRASERKRLTELVKASGIKIQ
jgi:tripartite-type tricarboxylate transporter receptor subunit TctC